MNKSCDNELFRGIFIQDTFHDLNFLMLHCILFAESCVDKLGSHSCKLLAKRYPNYDLCKVLKVMSIHCTKYCGLCGKLHYMYTSQGRIQDFW